MLRRSVFALVVVALVAPALAFSACAPTEGDPGPDGAGVDSAVPPDAPVADSAPADAAPVDATPDAPANPMIAKCEALFDAALAMARRCGAPAGTEISRQAYNPSDRAPYVSACVAQATAPGFDATRVDACLAEARTTTTCVEVLELEASLPPTFSWGSPRMLFECMQRPGALPAGSSCAYDSQCTSLRCHRARGAVGPEYCGVCGEGTVQVPPPGGGCVWPNRCGSGETCAGGCRAPAGNGEPCGLSCAPGLACSRNPSSQDTCQPLVALGGDCNGKYCQRGLTCIGGKCERATIGKLGDDCSYVSGREVQCDEDLTCQAVGTSGSRACVSVQSRFAQLGQACDTPGTMGCARTLWCDGGTCRLREASRCSLAPADAGSDAAIDAATPPKDAN